MKKNLVTAVAALTLMLAFATKTFAQKDQIEGIWFNGDKTSKIEIYLAKDGHYYGRIYWLKEPNDKDTGKPLLDKENPDENARKTPVQGLMIMRGFAKSTSDPNIYSDGTIYDPKNGKTYCGKITFKGKTLDLRGFICKWSFLGRTETWTLAEN
ncbi:MAG TPA: DUF2147 domain-containing protein [Chitinophagales bacterium]|nr:DUF2147 domain-containing protein [Chitinophagales bacterium]